MLQPSTLRLACGLAEAQLPLMSKVCTHCWTAAPQAVTISTSSRCSSNNTSQAADANEPSHADALSTDEAVASTSSASTDRVSAAQPPGGRFSQMQQFQTRSGYRESSLGSASVPPERLRIRLREEVVEQEHERQELDMYQLSRSILTPGSDLSQRTGAAAGLDATSKETLSKLVGIMTKDGKRSRAQRILLDAMHIMKAQLAKGAAQQQQGKGSEGAAASSKS